MRISDWSSDVCSSDLIVPVHGIGEITPGADLAGIIADACNARPATALLDGDVLVVTQQVVSKAEGRIEAIDTDDPRGHQAIVERDSVPILPRPGDRTESHRGGQGCVSPCRSRCERSPYKK